MTAAARITSAGAVLAGAAALAVVVLGAGHPVRGWYGLHPTAPSPIPAGRLFANNAKVCALPLLAAVYVRTWPRARWVLDPILVVLLAVNALLVGAAVGAYGGPLLRLIAAHTTLELLAGSAAGAAYVSSRRRPIPLSVLARYTAAAAGLLLVAAILEANGS